MDMTTVSLDKATRDNLQIVKEEQELPHYDAAVSWLINEVGE